jgi:hypothetical protein
MKPIGNGDGKRVTFILDDESYRILVMQGKTQHRTVSELVRDGVRLEITKYQLESGYGAEDLVKETVVCPGNDAPCDHKCKTRQACLSVDWADRD